MFYCKDSQLGGHVMKFSGPAELLDEAAKANCPMISLNDQAFNGRGFSNWQELKAAFHAPWKEGLQTVEQMLEEVKTSLPAPKSRRRRARWSETDGDVEVDRVLHGDPDFYRLVRREVSHGPSAVALLCNLDGQSSNTHESIFWRSAAAIASVDLLEEAGYACEVWLWCLGRDVYYEPYDKQFTCCQLKASGAAVDINNLVNSLSAWYLRTAVYGSFAAAPTKLKSIGEALYDLGPWRKYLDVSEGVLELAMPAVFSRQQAIDCARAILQQVIETND